MFMATSSVYGQAFCSITGTVWQDSRVGANGLIDVSEPGIPGVLVSLYNATGDTLVASALSRADGQYTIDNYHGEGTYFLSFSFPEEGYSVTNYRSGSDTSINSAVTDHGEGDIKRSDDITILSTHGGATLANYNLGLIMKANKIVYSTYKSSTSTEWTDTLKLPKSNASIGALDRVKLFVTNAARHPTIGVENTSITSASTGTVELGGKIAVRTPNNNTTSLVSQTSFVHGVEYPIYDGVTDYGGLSGDTWNDAYGAGYDDYNYPTSRNTDFVGTDSVGFPVLASGSVTITGGGNLSVNVSTFVAAGLFVIYEYDGGILPVTLSSFEAKKENSAALITWKTSAEKNNVGFMVQRSAEGKIFSDIGFVGTQSIDGNSFAELAYNFTDISPLNGKNIYRLKQVDIDGKVEYSYVRVLNFGQNKNLTAYPNPTHNTINIAAGSILSITLSDVTGRKADVPVYINETTATVDISKLVAGVYSLQVIATDGSVQQVSIVKN